MDKLIKFFDFIIKLPLSFLITFNVVLAILLFSPEKLSRMLVVYEFVKIYRIYLGPAFIFLFSILISKIIVERRNRRKALKKREEYLNSLTAEEKGYLSEFIKEEKNTIYCAMGDGIAGGLIVKGIIYKASNIVNVLDGDAFNLQLWARKFLNENIHLLDGAFGKPLTNEEKLFGNRAQDRKRNS
ncbi:MAG: super-infection exclusion protein B [Candidatus Omnitrophota bacterium]